MAGTAVGSLRSAGSAPGVRRSQVRPAGPLPVRLASPFVGRVPSWNLFLDTVSMTRTVQLSAMAANEEPNHDQMLNVFIYQDTDSDATIMGVSFGDRLGAFLNMMMTFQSLGLDVAKGSIATEGSVKIIKFCITKDGQKIEDPVTLENIRRIVRDNLLKYRPESSGLLTIGDILGVSPVEKGDVDIATEVSVQNDGLKRSMLFIETADRSGLLLDIFKVITYIGIEVESAEIETEGPVAKDKFHVSYHGTALDTEKSMFLKNTLLYHLRKPRRTAIDQLTSVIILLPPSPG